MKKMLDHTITLIIVYLFSLCKKEISEGIIGAGITYHNAVRVTFDETGWRYPDKPCFRLEFRHCLGADIIK